MIVDSALGEQEGEIRIKGLGWRKGLEEVCSGLEVGAINKLVSWTN